MSRRRRNLTVGNDGTAEVMLLTDPMPRHLSIVSWGANDRPASSWMSAFKGKAADALRVVPSKTVLDAAQQSVQAVEQYTDQTLAAWLAVLGQTLAMPLTGEERAARIRGFSAQAAARVAAVCASVGGPRMMEIARSVKSVELELPKVPTESTVDGELGRMAFMEAATSAVAYIRGACLRSMRDGPADAMTEAIYEAFASAGSMLAEWAEQLGDGVVGVATASVAAAIKAGARHGKADRELIAKIRELVSELEGSKPDADEPATEPEKKMLTLAMLSALVEEDPAGFLAVIKLAVDKSVAAKKVESPKAALKFAFGETGVGPYDDFSSFLGQNGDAILAMIVSAVSGVDIERQATSSSPQIASAMKSAPAMRSAFTKFLAEELKARPDGELSVAIKTIVAPSVGKGIVEALKSFTGPGTGPATDRGAFGMNDFEGAENDSQWLDVKLPSLR